VTASAGGSDVLAVTLGDPDGIGPEIILTAWMALRDSAEPFVVFADPDRLQPAARILNTPQPERVQTLSEARTVFQDAPPVFALQASNSAPGAAIASIEAAVAATSAGDAGAVVTAPVSKSRLYDEGFTFAGHTEFIAHLTADVPMTGVRGPVMMLAGAGLRTALVTIHLSLRDAIDQLSTQAIIHTARVTAEALVRDFAIKAPRLVIAGLNPHAGEGGALGSEDIEIVTPAVRELQRLGLNVAGPVPPDTMFHAEARAAYDAAICLYHDQGLIPVKTLDFHGGVNVTLGLPIIRTSPDHGTAFDIAGTGQARADSFIAALTLARSMARSRSQAKAEP
jgi:4-hydroxythreonine-4-phosphate dehydrogenase